MPKFKTKIDLFEFFNKYTVERKDELNERRVNLPLLKSYILETFAGGTDETIIQEIKGNGLQIETMEGNCYEIRDYENKKEPLGWLEPFSERYFAIYTIRKASSVDRIIENIIRESVKLDSLWLSDFIYRYFFNHIKNIFANYRFIKIKFEFDASLKWNLMDELIKEVEHPEIYDDNRENKTTSMDFTNTIEEVEQFLPELRKISPITTAKSISMLRYPGDKGGGHDFYYNGKVTNRSNSFIEHHHNINFMISIYSSLTRDIEEIVWVRQEKFNFKSSGSYLKGSPVVIEFEKPLDKVMFKNFVIRTFERGYGPFRLWGEPMYFSENKVHVYGLDLHLWQEVFLELTPEVFVMILPEGVCGNTVNRMITNIQHYLDPDFKVYIGEESYEDMVKKSLEEGLSL